jgi:PAT family beta-lactamase induction signal transducer AmpG
MQMIKVILSRRMFVALIMGFASGLPLLLTLNLLQAWMKVEKVDLTVIGFMHIVTLPYTIKFLWAPVMDRFTLPFLGRRRGWLLVAQILLICSIVGLGFTDPGKNLYIVAIAAFIVTFFSASQDIVVDAYRREDLADEELGLGSSLYVAGYRLGMLLAAGGGFILADHMSFTMVYLIMAACLIPAVITTLLTPEPIITEGTPKNMKEAVVGPLKDYFSREGAILMLLFILLYKVGDSMASAMTTPFYLDIGFSLTQIGVIVQTTGTVATIVGGLIGGVLMLRLKINRSLWVFGFLQAISTAGFALLAYIGKNIIALTGVVAFEYLCSGMGTAAFMAFIAILTNKKFTATQYALLTSLVGIPRVLASTPTGYFAKNMGWEGFFIFCTLMAIPGLLLLMKFAPWKAKQS